VILVSYLSSCTTPLYSALSVFTDWWQISTVYQDIHVTNPSRYLYIYVPQGITNKTLSHPNWGITNVSQRWNLTKFGSGGAFIRRDNTNANSTVRSVVVLDL